MTRHFLTATLVGLLLAAVISAQGQLKLILPDGLEIRRLYEIAAGLEVQIRRLSHKRDSLEDIFLKAMEAANGRL